MTKSLVDKQLMSHEDRKSVRLVAILNIGVSMTQSRVLNRVKIRSGFDFQKFRNKTISSSNKKIAELFSRSKNMTFLFFRVFFQKPFQNSLWMKSMKFVANLFISQNMIRWNQFNGLSQTNDFHNEVNKSKQDTKTKIGVGILAI